MEEDIAVVISTTRYYVAQNYIQTNDF